MRIIRPFGDWLALYYPDDGNNYDPSRRGFWTRRGGWKYVKSIEMPNGICGRCKDPKCDAGYMYAEWEVLKYNKSVFRIKYYEG